MPAPPIQGWRAGPAVIRKGPEGGMCDKVDNAASAGIAGTAVLIAPMGGAGAALIRWATVGALARFGGAPIMVCAALTLDPVCGIVVPVFPITA